MKKIIIALLALCALASTQVLARRNVFSKNLIDFNFVDKDLTEIIEMLALHDGKNVLLPQSTNAITQKINIKLPNKITSDQAWEYVSFFLNLAGYTIVPHNGLLMIIKNEVAPGGMIASNRETLPIYVGYNPQDFPHTDNKIRAILYLKNLKVPEKDGRGYYDPNPTAQGDPINMILTDVLSPTKLVTYDIKSNAIIASDSANKLSTAFNIITLLDNSGEPNVLEEVRLYNVDAETVANLLKTQIIPAADPKGAVRADVKSETGLYFGANPVHIVADNRLGSIFITGSGPTVERVKDLLAELDQPADSGKSILHVYELQYLEAKAFGPILQNIVNAGLSSGQSTKDLQGSTRKAFEGVLVQWEKAVEEKDLVTQLEASGKALLEAAKVLRSGNRLIVTAREHDWLKIKDLIQSLDIPQAIAIIEVLVLDVTMNENKILGAQARNPTNMPLPTGVTGQTNLLNLSPTAANSSTTPPTLASLAQGAILNVVNGVVQPEPAKLAADLLTLINPASSPNPAYSLAQQLSAANPGSLIVSANDPSGTGIWGVLQVLDSYADVKILSHPFLVARNNKESEAVISQIRRNVGQVFAGQAAVTSQKVEDIEARLQIRVIPRISSLDRINLQIAVDIQNFTTANQNDFTRNIRQLNTNTNLSSGQLLALGGLSELIEVEAAFKVPILSDIPIIGPLFQYSTRVTTRATLLILISPTVIEPKIRGGLDIYTRDKIFSGFEVFETESIVVAPRDPVTRWFFKSKLADAEESTNVYLSEAKGDFVREFQNKNMRKRDNTRSRRYKRGKRAEQGKPKATAGKAPPKEYIAESKFGL